MMKKVYFASDFHFGIPDRHRSRAREDLFVKWLDMASGDASEIFLMGDLFDFWFEYRHVIFSGYFDVLRAFADLRDAGVTLHFVCGNHDFWAGRFLENDLDFHIYRDPVTIEFGKRRVLLAHGDGLNKKDWGYRIEPCGYSYKRWRHRDIRELVMSDDPQSVRERMKIPHYLAIR